MWILESVDLNGVTSTFDETPRGYTNTLSFSPSGDRFAYDHFDGQNQNIAVVDVSRGNAQQLTSHSSNDSNPVWDPSGENVFFTSHRDAGFSLWTLPVDLSGPVKLVLESDSNK